MRGPTEEELRDSALQMHPDFIALEEAVAEMKAELIKAYGPPLWCLFGLLSRGMARMERISEKFRRRG